MKIIFILKELLVGIFYQFCSKGIKSHAMKNAQKECESKNSKEINRTKKEKTIQIKIIKTN